MAVEKQRVIDRLKAKFAKANFSAARIDALAERLCLLPEDGADDAAVDAVLDQANTFVPFSEIAATDDKIRNLEAKVKPVPPIPGNPPTPPTPPNPNDDTPSWAKAIIEQNQTMAAKLEAIEAGKATDLKKGTVNELFAKSEVFKGMNENLKSKWMKRLDVNSETPLEDQILEVENEFTELKQSFADSTEFAGKLPNSFNNSAPSDKELEDAIAKM